MQNLKTPRLILLFFVSLLSGGIAARPIDAIQKSGTIKLATEGAFPPFNFFKNGVLGGFEIDLANEIARKLGVHADWTTQSFDSLLIGLNQDRYDMVVASHAVTPERSRAVDFIHPHYCSGGVILAKKGGPQTLHDLTGKTVAAQVSSIYPKFLEKTGGISSIKELPKDTDCIQALLTGRVDAVVTDRFVAVTALKANPGAGLQFGKFINPEHNAMAVARGNTSLKKAVDQALAELMKDGTYARLSQQYFGEDIRCK